MKSVLIIGLGRFGHHLCKNMIRLGNEVMVVDKVEANVEDLLPIATTAKIGDCTNEEVLRNLGVGNLTSVLCASAPIFRAAWRLPVWLRNWEGNMW